MIGIASGVLRVFKIEIAVVGTLRIDTAQESITLGGFHIFNESFLRLEVERHALTFIVFAPLFVDGRSLKTATRAVGHTLCMDDGRVHIEGDVVGRQIHILIVHLGIAIKMGESGGGIID